MGRPAKPIRMTHGHQTKAETEFRKNAEDKLKGNNATIRTPNDLTSSQKKHFKFVVTELQQADTLCKLDTSLLKQYARCQDRIEAVEKLIDENPAMVQDKDIVSIRNTYNKELRGWMNELGLSPQARSKLAISMQKNDQPKTIGDYLNDDE